MFAFCILMLSADVPSCRHVQYLEMFKYTDKHFGFTLQSKSMFKVTDNEKNPNKRKSC